MLSGNTEKNMPSCTKYTAYRAIKVLQHIFPDNDSKFIKETHDAIISEIYIASMLIFLCDGFLNSEDDAHTSELITEPMADAVVDLMVMVGVARLQSGRDKISPEVARLIFWDCVGLSFVAKLNRMDGTGIKIVQDSGAILNGVIKAVMPLVTFDDWKLGSSKALFKIKVSKVVSEVVSEYMNILFTEKILDNRTLITDLINNVRSGGSVDTHMVVSLANRATSKILKSGDKETEKLLATVPLIISLGFSTLKEEMSRQVRNGLKVLCSTRIEDNFKNLVDCDNISVKELAAKKYKVFACEFEKSSLAEDSLFLSKNIKEDTSIIQSATLSQLSRDENDLINDFYKSVFDPAVKKYASRKEPSKYVYKLSENDIEHIMALGNLGQIEAIKAVGEVLYIDSGCDDCVAERERMNSVEEIKISEPSRKFN